MEFVGPDAWDRIGDWDEVVAESAAPSVFLTRDWVKEAGAGEAARASAPS